MSGDYGLISGLFIYYFYLYLWYLYSFIMLVVVKDICTYYNINRKDLRKLFNKIQIEYNSYTMINSFLK